MLSKEKIKSSKTILCCDTEESLGIEVYCYTECSNSSEEIIKRSRGLVYKGDKLIFEGLPYTDEYPLQDPDLQEKIEPLLADSVIQEAYEGNIIRVFSIENTWYITTHRKLDAFQSKWGANKTSFGELFQCAVEHLYTTDEKLSDYLDRTESETKSKPTKPDVHSPVRAVLERLLASLDIHKQYMFLVSHNEENRIVSLCPQTPFVYHICTQEADGFKTIEDDDIGFPKAPVLSFSSYTELTNYIQSVNCWTQQGVVILPRDKKRLPIKILNDMYHYLFHLRNNEQSVKFRYLQLRNDPQGFHWFCTMYPMYLPEFQQYEQLLAALAEDLLNAYQTRYVKGEWIVLPPDEFSILKKINEWHLEQPQENVSLDVITEIVNSRPAHHLNKIIRRRIKQDKTKSQSDCDKNTSSEVTLPESEVILELNTKTDDDQE